LKGKLHNFSTNIIMNGQNGNYSACALGHWIMLRPWRWLV